jgi:hypothetical protein
MIKKGDIVKRIDGKQISFCLPSNGMTAKVIIGQGESLEEYAWHYPGVKTVSIDYIGLGIGLFPTFVKAIDYVVVNE